MCTWVLQGNEESKPVQQVAESAGTTDATKTGFLAHPPSHYTPKFCAAVGGQTGMAAEAGNALTEIPSGIQADKSAVAHTEGTGETLISASK